MVRAQPPRQEGSPTNGRFVPHRGSSTDPWGWGSRPRSGAGAPGSMKRTWRQREAPGGAALPQLTSLLRGLRLGHPRAGQVSGRGTFASVAVSLGQAPDGADSVRITRLPVWDHDRVSTTCVASPDAVRSSPVGGGVLWTGSGEVASARTRSCCCWGGPRLSCQTRRVGRGPGLTPGRWQGEHREGS